MLGKAENAILVIDMLNDFVLPDSPMLVDGAYSTLPELKRFIDYGKERKWPVICVNRSHRSSVVESR